MEMHRNENTAGTDYWGNSFVQDPSINVARGEWTCVEYRVRLNQVLSGHDGELTLWVNDTPVVHLATDALNGYWFHDRYFPEPLISSYEPDRPRSPFRGFRFRESDQLQINWFSLDHYVTEDPAGLVGWVEYDQVILARSRIGCVEPI